jgi:hypothetical protein
VFTFDELERRVSTARAATYLAAAERDKSRAVALYEWHIELTGALFSVVAGVGGSTNHGGFRLPHRGSGGSPTRR